MTDHWIANHTLVTIEATQSQRADAQPGGDAGSASSSSFPAFLSPENRAADDPAECAASAEDSIVMSVDANKKRGAETSLSSSISPFSLQVAGTWLPAEPHSQHALAVQLTAVQPFSTFEAFEEKIVTVARTWGQSVHFTRQVNVGGKWVVGLPTVALVQKFVEAANNIALTTGWRPAPLPPKAPCLRLTRLPRKLTTAQLVGELQEEKNSIFHTYREFFGEMFILRQTQTTVILRLHPALRIALLQHQDKLLIRRTRPGVEDVVPLQQCFKCCKFGHSKANCQYPPRCIFCARDHAGAQCPNADNTFLFACGNCRDAKRMTRGHSHPAIDLEYCPVALDRQRSLRLQMVYDPALYQQLYDLWRTVQPARQAGQDDATEPGPSGNPSGLATATAAQSQLAVQAQLFHASQTSSLSNVSTQPAGRPPPALRPRIVPIPPPPVVAGKSPSALDIQLRELAKQPQVGGGGWKPPPPPPALVRRPKARPPARQGDSGGESTITTFFKHVTR